VTLFRFLHLRNGMGLAACLVIVLALSLAGCGGGGGKMPMPPGDANGDGTPGDDDGEMSLMEKWQRFEAGNPALRMTSAQIEKAYDSRSKRASHDLYWGLDPVLVVPGEDPPEESFSYSATVDQHEHEDLSLPPGIVFAPVLEHNGVRIAELKGRYTDIDEDDGETELTDFVTYGGWLDHTVFGVTSLRVCEVGAAGCSGTNPVYAWGDVGGLTTYGVHPGTTPTGMGSATWTGVMVGMESPRLENQAAALAWLNEGRPDVFLGDARIEVDDLSAPDVDVSFTNIHNVTEGTRHRDMSWEGLSVENGLFGSGDSDEYIAGMFTGPRHQEVGGEFQRDGIAGGFGAKRRQ